jgi:hypothetical protein
MSCPRGLTLKLGLLMLFACATQSCQPVLTTTALEATSQQSARVQSCKAGTYSLPRTLLSFYSTYSGSSDGKPARYELSDISPEVTVDEVGPFCADFPVSGWSTDKINVQRTENGLLKHVSTSNEDQSLKIAEKVVGAAAAIASSESGQRGAVGIVEKKFIRRYPQVDPFDEAQMRSMNNSLMEDGYCIYIDPTDDPVVDNWQSTLCPGVVARGTAVVRTESALRHAVRAAPPKTAGARGLIYRPLLTHRIVTMKRNENSAGGHWEFHASQYMAMTNGAPFFLLEIRRSPFVTRTFDAVFDLGVLQSVKISKPSEAEALSGFVLSTAQAIIAVPVRALVFGKTETQNRQALISAQADLLDTIYAFNEAVSKEASGGADAENRSSNGPRAGARSHLSETAAMSGSMPYDACMKNSVMINPENPEVYCEALSTSGDP